jgi:hypothetical protein
MEAIPLSCKDSVAGALVVGPEGEGPDELDIALDTSGRNDSKVSFLK